MCSAVKIPLPRKHMDLFIGKNLGKKLLILVFFFMLQCYSSTYAMQQEESIEQQNVRRIAVTNTAENLNPLSQEEEEAIPLSSVTRERKKHWKQSWFVENVIVEFPIIGDLFHYNSSVSDTLKRVGKSTCMLVGGCVGMMWNFIPMENDNMAANIAVGSINMAIGMWAASTTYNIVLSLGTLVYQRSSAPHPSSQDSLSSL